MSRAVVATLAAVLLVVSLFVSPAVAAPGADRLQTPDRFDTTTFRVELHENGSATWTIEHYQPLDTGTDNETEQFRAYAANFEDNETALYRNFVADAETLTRVGTNETDRQMDARNFERSAGVEPVQERGAVRMTFLWTNFAQVYDRRVVVSDVFAGEFYLGDGQRMVFEHDTSMVFTAAEPGPDSLSAPDSLAESQSITYNGEQLFPDNRPYVELGPPGAQTTGTPTTTPGTAAGENMWRFALLLAVIALGAVAAAAWRSGAAGAVLGGDDGDSGATAESATDSASDTAIEEPALLDDDDRVIKLLEENGGRMKQVDIVETTDWSKSKVSMLLSDMEEAGDISKLRVGRENIISLAGEEPDAAGSPFDEE
ncbi:helix-turn-helix transcriptional regulator [Haloarcula sediminis]|uniref:helix-turn-helix transcriptional regulator n=1 Tax=Haloarcula sediminis TaxID=3111777 RepID=UPI002D795BE5|nr:helix-turn-helix domain-containing protein [Haloarcula sp. CK38]